MQSRSFFDDHLRRRSAGFFVRSTREFAPRALTRRDVGVAFLTVRRGLGALDPDVSSSELVLPRVVAAVEQDPVGVGHFGLPVVRHRDLEGVRPGAVDAGAAEDVGFVAGVAHHRQEGDRLGEGWYLVDVQAHYSIIGDLELVQGGQLLALNIPPGKNFK